MSREYVHKVQCAESTKQRSSGYVFARPKMFVFVSIINTNPGC